MSEESSCHNCANCASECDLFKNGACKGKAVDGEYAVAKGSIRFIKSLLGEKTEVEAAQKEPRKAGARVKCTGCGHEGSVQEFTFLNDGDLLVLKCPRCDSDKVKQKKE